ncbi:aldose 1-epimerase [Parvibaculum sp.]|uniref:aldose 1-epimerase n=1 Tax=Parvibaculum sp. TaxID=2024848 RepID=UPI001B2B8DB2|nr:aldose 1-epimerase [Parvibaculum sp.]MBO6668088.1 aldose 1-epimerase [Parvibaculum sp.]MBO6692014.1 aldose 1-epimerase [Parvibaculum sp.]MBO6715596.1 aldose 1-epimerase [Parvibaculum sp.]
MLTLTCGNLEAVLAPEFGGCIARFAIHHENGTQELLRPLPQGLSRPSPLDMACYPLVPFSGRITNGRFKFGGREVRLPPDEICVPHAIHGRGWKVPWRVADAYADRASLSFSHEGDDPAWPWPWSFEARQHIWLRDDALVVTMHLTNHSSDTMPGGLGLHPFFPGRSTAEFRAKLPEVWESGVDGVPIGIAANPEKWRFDEFRSIRDIDVDNCFSGSDGHFDVQWPDRPYRLRVEAGGAPHTIVFAPPSEDFFCAEPVSHAPDAVNRPEPFWRTGLDHMPPRTTKGLKCSFFVEKR